MKARLSWAHGKEQTHSILEGTCGIVLNSLVDALRGLWEYVKLLMGQKWGKGGMEVGMLEYGILETMGMLVTHKHVVHFSSQMLHLIIAICRT